MKWHVNRWRLDGDAFGDAIVWVAGWSFHLSTSTSDGCSFTFGPRRFLVDVRW